MKLNNREVAEACEACKMKYSALGFDRANVAFAYEFQGYVAAMVDQYGQIGRAHV